jgi:hypothetical protein
MLGIGLFLVAVAHSEVVAQLPTAQVVRERPNGTYVVRIGDQTMLAIPDSMYQALLASDTMVDVLRAQLRTARDSILHALKSTLPKADSAVADAMAYITHLESLNSRWRDLAGRYRRLAHEAWLTFDVGAGATGGDKSPALVAGLGFRRIRFWTFFQERNSGGAVGVSLRLY